MRVQLIDEVADGDAKLVTAALWLQRRTLCVLGLPIFPLS